MPFFSPKWKYVKNIRYSACDKSIYQQDIVIHRSAGTDYEETSGGLNIWHIHVGSQCKTDYGDLRFTDRYGNELSYYLWPDYDLDSGKFCVKLDSADKTGTLSIWFGNSKAKTTSNGDAVYEFFDQFDGSEIDTIKWDTSLIGSYTGGVSDGILSITALSSVERYLEIKKSGSRIDFSGDYIVSTRCKIDSVRDGNGRAGIVHKSETPNGHGYCALISGAGNAFRALNDQVRWGSAKESITADTWYIVSARYADRKLYFQLNSGSWYYESRSGRSGTTALNLGYTRGYTSRFDWVIVRIYSASPPSFQSSHRSSIKSYISQVNIAGGSWSVPISISANGLVISNPLPALASLIVVPTTIEVIDILLLSGESGANFTAPSALASLTMSSGSLASFSTPTATTTLRFGLNSLYRKSLLKTPAGNVSSGFSSTVTPVKIFTQLDQYKWISAKVTKSASNPVGSLTIQIDGTSVPPSGSNMNIVVKDHTGTDRCIFCGVIFDPKFYIQAGRRYASVIGYEYGYYLANQSLTGQDYVFPEDENINNIVMYWLEGENGRWWETTGIKPHKVLNQYMWSHHSYVPKEFVFGPNYSKADGIDEITEYANMVFLVQTGKDGDSYCPLAYMVHADNVDDMTAGLDLPDLAWFKWPDPYVVDINLTSKSSEKINRVIVRGTSDIGATFEYVREHPLVTAGEMFPIELLEESKDYADSNLVVDRANYLYNKYAGSAVTVEVTFKDRVDLKLYQLVKFFDFPGIPEDTMRIISISYELTAASKTVKITATSNIDIYNIKGLDRSQSADSVAEIETIASNTVAKKVIKPEIGEVASVDGNNGTVELERGGTISVRFLE